MKTSFKCSKTLIILCITFSVGNLFAQVKNWESIRSAEIWPDTNGQHINAHCGCIFKHGDTYYWFGENRLRQEGSRMHVTCYASKDLKNWEFRNTVLKNLGEENGFIERPKVVYNEKTKKFVMWMHKEDQSGYSAARCAVASSDQIDGTYTYHGSFRPNDNLSRDCYLFKDDDGTAYFVSSSDNNATLAVYQLTPDYLKVEKQLYTLFVGQYREAPAIFKRKGIYYLVSSFCTGTKPNQQYYSMAKSMKGPWSENFLLCSTMTWNTYYSQTACVFAVPGTEDTTYVYNGDRWVSPMRHIWLPLEFNADGTIKSVEWYDEWSINAVTGRSTHLKPPVPLRDNIARGKTISSTYNSDGNMFDYGHMANHEANFAVDGNSETFWSPNDNLPHWLKVDLGSTMKVTGTQVSFWKGKTNWYKVETSTDNVKWNLVVDKTSGSPGQNETDDFQAADVRYVRIWRMGAPSGYDWPGIKEFAVFSNGINVAQGKAATSDNFQAKTDMTKAVDGDFATAWTIDNGELPQSITIDLGVAINISGVRILWESPGFWYHYLIETSSDEKTWQPYAQNMEDTKAVWNPLHLGKVTHTRYVRVTLSDYDRMGREMRNSMSAWPGIREIEVINNARSKIDL